MELVSSLVIFLQLHDTVGSLYLFVFPVDRKESAIAAADVGEQTVSTNVSC
jgi:hypothetical protein